MLPSIRITAKEFRVSIITVKKAWEMLERNGLIYTVTGKGSFVRSIDSDTIARVRKESIEEDLRDIIEVSCQLGLKRGEFLDMVKALFDEAENGK